VSSKGKLTVSKLEDKGGIRFFTERDAGKIEMAPGSLEKRVALRKKEARNPNESQYLNSHDYLAAKKRTDGAWW